MPSLTPPDRMVKAKKDKMCPKAHFVLYNMPCVEYNGARMKTNTYRSLPPNKAAYASGVSRLGRTDHLQGSMQMRLDKERAADRKEKMDR